VKHDPRAAAAAAAAPQIRAFGDWSRSALRVTWTASGRRTVPEVERVIENSWEAAARRLGDKLFDGPMCRLERWSATPDHLDLTLSRTSYKPFLGTNLHHADLADTFGPDILANPVGLSTALQTSDGWLLLGRRNDSVAYYPNRVHPFAGALEPPTCDGDALDVFAEVLRELREELSLSPADLSDLRCIGLAEDPALRQPELIFAAASTRTRAEIEATLDREEHHSTYPVRATASDVRADVGVGVLTPVAVAVLLLWGRGAFGEAWFAAAAAATAGRARAT
jgi:hypothetical protein